MAPPFGKKYVFLTYKKVGKLGMAPPFVKAPTSLRRLSPGLTVPTTPPRSQRTSPTTPPLEVTEPRRLPPPRSHRTSPTTPPLEVTETRRLPPLEVTEPRRLPPPRSHNRNLPTTPPRKIFGPPLIEFLNTPLAATINQLGGRSTIT